jgi:hypothetical protein
MKRYVVLSTNNNPDYYSYLPFQERAWNRFGWDLIVMITADVDPLLLETTNPNTLICRLPNIPELRPQTIAQAGRLYAAHYVDKDCLLMTCDMDLIPLSNYWNPDQNQITVYGHDLTDYSYIPMGYVAMTAERWIEVMNITSDTKADMLRDANSTMIKDPDTKQMVVAAYSENWGAYWNYDWRLLTDRLQPYIDRKQINFIKRGRRTTGTYAYGRVDRGDGMKVPPGETLIDAHCENFNTQATEKLEKFLNVYESVHGKQ